MRPDSQSSRLDVTSLNMRWLTVVLVALAIVPVGGAALQAEDNIADLIQQARSSFKPVSEKEVAAARADLRRHIDEVADFVNPSSENGKHWFRYLRLDALKKAVAEDRPKDLAPFDATLLHLNLNKTAL